MPKLKQFEVIGETTQGVWTKQYAKASRKLVRSGKKLSRQQFVRRTVPGAREYAEYCARQRVKKFTLKDTRYVEGEIEGRQVVLMAAGKLIWMFREHPPVPNWGTPVAQEPAPIA